MTGLAGLAAALRSRHDAKVNDALPGPCGAFNEAVLRRSGPSLMRLGAFLCLVPPFAGTAAQATANLRSVLRHRDAPAPV